jgi:Ulp1 family protease
MAKAATATAGAKSEAVRQDSTPRCIRSSGENVKKRRAASQDPHESMLPTEAQVVNIRDPNQVTANDANDYMEKTLSQFQNFDDATVIAKFTAGRASIEIKGEDVKRLSGSGQDAWLNDTIMEFALRGLMEDYVGEDIKLVPATTFFYNKLQDPDCMALTWNDALSALIALDKCKTSEAAHCECLWETEKRVSVLKLTRRKRLFPTERLIMPVNDNFHWFLVVVDFNDKKIRIIDSLGHEHPAVYKHVKRWLKSEHESEKTSIDWELENTFETWSESVRGAQQDDSYNCGVFVLGYVRAMLTGKAMGTFTRAACNQMRVDIFNWVVHGEKLIY